MVGEKNLEKLINSMMPVLIDIEYVFCSFHNSHYGDHLDLEPIAAIQEKEGLTLVIPKTKADENNLNYQTTFKRITLNVHSDLEAVGFTAALSNKLTEHGISANVLAGYYHDHVFVQSSIAKQAIDVLYEFVRK